MGGIVCELQTKSTLESSDNQENINLYFMSGIWQVKVKND